MAVRAVRPELTTAVKYGIPFKHVFLNNNALGKIGK
jgi:pyruvate oxidase